jgi:hypothetical protein
MHSSARLRSQHVVVRLQVDAEVFCKRDQLCDRCTECPRLPCLSSVIQTFKADLEELIQQFRNRRCQSMRLFQRSLGARVRLVARGGECPQMFDFPSCRVGPGGAERRRCSADGTIAARVTLVKSQRGLKKRGKFSSSISIGSRNRQERGVSVAQRNNCGLHNVGIRHFERSSLGEDSDIAVVRRDRADVKHLVEIVSLPRNQPRTALCTENTQRSPLPIADELGENKANVIR